MAIVSVSNASQLQKALDSAGRGDKIVLDAGNYGSLSLNGNSNKADYKFDGVTIASKSKSNPATFTDVNLTKVTNVTFDGVKFDYNASSDSSKPFLFNGTQGISIVNSVIDGMLSNGYGSGYGLWVKDSSSFRLENTEIVNFRTGAHIRAVDNLKVIDNSFDNASVDSMILARIDGALVEGNRIEMMNGDKGNNHRDMIQLWNNDVNAPSSDVVIRGNTLISDENTQGIYMSNDVARRGGGLDSFHRDILIENNTIKSGQVHGIVVGETVGVTIRGNSVLQHGAIDSDRPVHIPVIRIEDDARNVSITGNTTHRAPAAADGGGNWQPKSETPGDWKISDNKIVPIGTDVNTSGGGAKNGSSSGAVSKPVAPEAPAGEDGNGKADNFRFKGPIDGKESVTFTNVDFSEGDRILLQNFDRGTFLDFAGGSGNKVVNSTDKSYVRIDSLTDIQELVTASKDLSVSFQTKNDVLLLKIAQDDGTLSIALPGFADDYKATFDDSLF